jgi:hypothetical protein
MRPTTTVGLLKGNNNSMLIANACTEQFRYEQLFLHTATTTTTSLSLESGLKSPEDRVQFQQTSSHTPHFSKQNELNSFCLPSIKKKEGSAQQT